MQRVFVVYIGSGQHSLVNGDAHVDESGFVSGSSTPRIPAVAGGLRPTAPPCSTDRSSLSSNLSTVSSSQL